MTGQTGLLAIFTVPSVLSCFSSHLPVPSVCDRRDKQTGHFHCPVMF